jgi:hypothetical protein
MPRENSHGEYLRFMKDVAQMRYITPKMDAPYAFFLRERSIFNLWQLSIISMADLHRGAALLCTMVRSVSLPVVRADAKVRP